MNTEAASVNDPIFVVPRTSSTDWIGGANLDRTTVKYAAYWENDNAEKLVFFVDEARKPWLIHSDCGNDPIRLEDGRAPGILLADEEKMWLAACWKASEWKRNKHPSGS